MLGIDTPEVEEAGHADRVRRAAGVGRDAAARAGGRRRRARGRAVALVADPSQDAVDRYGRVLAYVEAGGRGPRARRWSPRAGRRSTSSATAGSAHRARYKRAARRARDARLGVYGRCGGDFHSAR